MGVSVPYSYTAKCTIVLELATCRHVKRKMNHAVKSVLSFVPAVSTNVVSNAMDWNPVQTYLVLINCRLRVVVDASKSR